MDHAQHLIELHKEKKKREKKKITNLLGLKFYRTNTSSVAIWAGSQSFVTSCIEQKKYLSGNKTNTSI